MNNDLESRFHESDNSAEGKRGGSRERQRQLGSHSLNSSRDHRKEEVGDSH